MTTKKNMRMLALFGKNIQQKNGTLPPCGLIKDFREMGTADRKKGSQSQQPLVELNGNLRSL